MPPLTLSPLSNATSTPEHLELLPAVTSAAHQIPQTPSAATTLGMAHLDAGLRVVTVNDALCEQLGLSSAEVRGESLSRFFHPTARKNLRKHFSQLLADPHGGFSIPMTLVDANGGDNDCLVTGLALDSVIHSNCTSCTAIALIAPDAPHSPPLSLAPAPTALTEVPARILEGVASGLSTQQLASRLGLSSHGVEYHISGMLRKLKAPSRSALVARAYALNIFLPNCWPPRVRPQYTARFPGNASSGTDPAATPAHPDPAAARPLADEPV